MSGSKAGAARARGGKGRGNAGAAPAPAARGAAASRAREAPTPPREVAASAREASAAAGDAADAGPREGEYVVSLPTFEGPLDLLLHLIQQHELDILDIPVSFVTEKYLEYLKIMRSLSIDLASEYLVMAATLAHIKSKMLLPSVPAGQDDDGMPGEEEDPRAELVRRLLEYQKYKVAAADLAERGTLGRDVFTRGMSESEVPKGPAPFASTSIFGLLDAFERVLKRTNVQIDHEVVFDRISITDRIVELTEKLSARRAMRFEDLLLDSVSKGGVIPRFEVVITFLAVLEMCKLRLIRVHQTDSLAPIHILLSVAEGEPPVDFDPDDGAPTAERSETTGSDEAGAPPAGAPAEPEVAEAAEAEEESGEPAEPEVAESAEAAEAGEESGAPAEPEVAETAEAAEAGEGSGELAEPEAAESAEAAEAEEESGEPAEPEVAENAEAAEAEEESGEPAEPEVAENAEAAEAEEESGEPAEPEVAESAEAAEAEEESGEPAGIGAAAAAEAAEAEAEGGAPAEPEVTETAEAEAESGEPATPELAEPSVDPSGEPAPPELAGAVEETGNAHDVAGDEPAREADAGAAPAPLEEPSRDAIAETSGLSAPEGVAAPPAAVDEVDAGSGRDGG
ncbi:segregation and condensation protein A [Sorangium sp. So ce406]|uniref:segregation and condensation protein A n=1 Tax=Sorangium sp. So ce406 TaxID=3133311 RepID=UPI003F5AFD62